MARNSGEVSVLVAGIQRWGDNVGRFEVADPGAPRHGEALIQVKAAGVGSWDELVRKGEWGVGSAPPLALGIEAAGVVRALGPGVERWSSGDSVLTHPLPLLRHGTWAPWLLARADLLVAKPVGVSWSRAGAFAIPALTAMQVIDDVLKMRPGETLLIHGGGGVTGGLLVSLAGLRGVHVIATAGPSSCDRVARIGAEAVLDYNDPGWPRRVLQLTAGGVNAAATLGKSGAAQAMSVVIDSGRLAAVTPDRPEPGRGIQVHAVRVHPDTPQLEAACRALSAGQLPFNIAARFSPMETCEALSRAIVRRGGAVVLEMD